MQLKKIILHSLVIRSRRDALTQITKTADSPAADSAGQAQMQYRLARHSERPAFRLPLRLRIEWPPESGARFTEIQIDIEGFFEFPQNTPDEEIRRYMPILGLVNLYGAARALIAQSTSMSDGGAFIIPNINMNDVVRQNAEQKKETVPSNGEETSSGAP
jgi:preprotein translocase subunit SecB